MILMITEQGATVNLNGGKVEIRTKDMLRSLPKELIETVSLFGNIQLTTQFVKFCILNGIPISYFSSTGEYFGRTASTSHNNIIRLQKHMKILENETFQIGFAKSIIEAKVNNQLTVLRRYSHHNNAIGNEIIRIEQISKNIGKADSKESVLGYEGIISKHYFKALSVLMPNEFKFKGRSRRPPRDPFNSVISLGYTILIHEMIGQIEAVGLSPYGGIIHGHRRNHPSLASDLIEEFRSSLVDSLAIDIFVNRRAKIEDFDINSEGVFLQQKFLKKFLRDLQVKMLTDQSYIKDGNLKLSYRKAIYHQCKQLAKAIEEDDCSIYKPLKIR